MAGALPQTGWRGLRPNWLAGGFHKQPPLQTSGYVPIVDGAALDKKRIEKNPKLTGFGLRIQVKAFQSSF